MKSQTQFKVGDKVKVRNNSSSAHFIMFIRDTQLNKDTITSIDGCNIWISDYVFTEDELILLERENDVQKEIDELKKQVKTLGKAFLYLEGKNARDKITDRMLELIDEL